MKASRSPTGMAMGRLFKNRLAVLGLIWLIVVASLALAVNIIIEWQDHPMEFSVYEHKNLPPTWIEYTEEQKKRSTIDPEDIEDDPEFYAHNMESYWFGTDKEGRDLFVRVIYGCRVSLFVALIATVVSVILGVSWGAIAGYCGGWVDEIMMRFVDILYALPYIFFVIMVMSIFGKNEFLMFACIGAISWLTMSRIIRGEVKSLKERDFITAGRALGASPKRLIFAHIVPNTMSMIIIYSTLMVPQIILTETFLSFLGLGIQPPKPSLGNLLTEAASLTSLENYIWQLAFPGAMLSLTLLALNFLGDGLRDAFDPRQMN